MSEIRYKILGVFLLLLCIWSSTWMFMKISVGDTPFFAASIRFFLASGILVIYQKCRRKPIGIQREHLYVYMIMGLLNFAVSYGLIYWAMSLMYSNLVSLLWATFPVQVAAFAHFLLPKEKLNLGKIFSLVLAVIGSAFIFNVSSGDMGPDVKKGITLVLFSIAAAACSAGMNVARRDLKTGQMRSAATNWIQHFEFATIDTREAPMFLGRPK